MTASLPGPGGVVRADPRLGLWHVPAGDLDDEPAAAVVDFWRPPDALSVPLDVCGRVRALAESSPAHEIPGFANGAYVDLDGLAPEDERAVVERFAAANALWWRLAIDLWHLRVKRYAAGDEHRSHTDWRPGLSARRKLAGSVPLSEPAEYEGGALFVEWDGQRVDLPRARGTLAAFPGWTVHGVHPVTRGVRWALVVNGYGPELR